MAMVYSTDVMRSLSDVEADAVAVADVLRDHGVRPGDRVLLKADNSVGYLVCLLGLAHAGASILLLDNQERADTTARLLDIARVRLCVADDDATMPETDLPVLSVYRLRLEATGRAPAEQLDLGTWRALPDGLLMCSSGSTGTPKVVVKTGESFLLNLRRNIDLVGHDERDVLLPLLPFSHQYGLSILMIAWLARCSLVIAPYRRLDHALRMGALCGATVLDATPSSYQSLFNMARGRAALDTALRSARMLCVGAAPLNASLVRQYVEHYGKPLLDSYGSTEMGNVAFANTGNPVLCGQAVDGVELKVVDEDDATVPPGVVGEILVRIPDLMQGYLREDGTLDPTPRGWYRTADLGSLDERGNLHVIGRKRAVHRMGFTLFPDMIERKLEAAGCVAKLVSVPDDRLGSMLVAFVEDEERRSAAYWRERAADVVPAHELPNRFVVLDSLPLNRNGKPDNKRLEQLAVSA